MSTIQRAAGFLLHNLAAVIVTKRFLIRPAVGLANNNDFVKMAGLLGLGPEEGTSLFPNLNALPSLVFVPQMPTFGLVSRGQARAAWLASSVILAGAAHATLRQNPSDYRRANVDNIVLLRNCNGGSAPASCTARVGPVGQRTLSSRTTAFAPQGPTDNPKWVKRFTARCDYGSIARYYFGHPLVTMRFLYEGLWGDASRLRPWGDRSVDDGFKPGARETRFGYWRDFRGFLLRIAPWHMVLLVIGVLGGGLWLLLYSPRDRAFASLVLRVQTLAVTEYAVAILADAVETSRHLIVFHAATDMSILLAPVLISKIVSWGREGKRAYPTS